MNANGSTNGHASPAPSKEQVRQARLRNAMLEAELRGQLLDRVHKQAQHELRESYPELWVNAINDRLERYRADPSNYGFSRYWDRRYGRNIPVYQNEHELSLLRMQSRIVTQTNGYAIGLAKGLMSYVIGTGYIYEAISKDKDKPATEELLKGIQRIIDGFLERTQWRGGEQPAIEEELFFRSLEDGEFLIVHFAEEDRLDLQILEPEQLTQRPGSTFDEYGFGVRTEADRPDKPLAYWLYWADNAQDGEEYSPEQVTHFRRNVPRNIKRGVPDFSFDTLDGLRIASRLRRNMGLGAAVQAAYAVIRQHAPGVTSDQASDLRGLLADYTRTNDISGKTEHYQKIEPGIYDAPNGMVYAQPPNAQNAGAHVQILQAVLRSVGQRWNAPEWISSADASNSNYASSLTAESPFVIKVKQEQNSYKAVFLRSVYLAVKTYFEHHGSITVRETLDKEAGTLAERTYSWEDVRKLVDIQVEAPSPETRNKLEEAQVNQVYASLKIKSPQTIQAQLDLDKDEEAANWQEWDEKFGQQGGMGGMGDMFGGGGGGAPLPGGGGEQAPPEEEAPEPEAPAGEENPIADLSDEEIDAMSDEELAALFAPEETTESLQEASESLLEAQAVPKAPSAKMPSAKAPKLGGGKKGLGSPAQKGKGFTGKRREGKRIVCRSQGKIVPCPEPKGKSGTGKMGKGKGQGQGQGKAKGGGSLGAALGDLAAQAVAKGAEASAKFGLQGDVRGALDTATDFDAPKGEKDKRAEDKPAEAKTKQAKAASSKAKNIAAKTKDPAQKAKLQKVAKRLEDHSADITAMAMRQKAKPERQAGPRHRGQAGPPVPAGVKGTRDQMAVARARAAGLDTDRFGNRGAWIKAGAEHEVDPDTTQLLESTIATHLRQLSEQYDGAAMVVAEAAAKVLEGGNA